MIEDDYSFNCPHCGADMSVRLDASGGASQSFIQDCEVCCRPIQIAVKFQGEDVTDFSAEATE